MRFRAHRYRAVSQVGVLHAGERHASHVLDVSEGGMKLRLLLNAQPGEHVRLHAKGALVDAEIRWITGNQVGLKFLNSGDGSEKARFLARILPQKRLGARQFGFREL